MATNNALNNYSAPFESTTVSATTFDTNVIAAAVTLTGTTLSADGTDADISINITAKGAGLVIIDDLQLTTDLAVTEGGTGASTLTDHGVLIGSGTGAITPLSVGGTGVILTGVAGADPTWTTATYPATVVIGSILHASANNVVSDLTVGAVGEILQGNTGAAPSWLAASTDGKVLTAHTGAAPTWETPSSGGLTWSVITADQTAVINNGYICNKAGLLTVTLPATSVVDSVFRVTGMNTALGWKIAQAANQYIYFGTSTTTVGAGGSLASVNIHDSVELVCCVADLGWIVVSSMGNITIV
jgi:hypothetical protein